MAQVNPLTREVLIKLVYYGPGLGGKTTTLQRVHAVSPAETRGKIVSLATPVDRTLYFDFLPIRVGPVNGYPVRLQLFTVPGQVYFNATRKLVLTGADGVVFVADSQLERQDANLESLQNLKANLSEQKRQLEDIPHVFQFNKRDLPNAVELAVLTESLNPRAAPSFASCASKGQGVLEPLDELVRLVLEDLTRREVFGSQDARHMAGPSFGPTADGLGASLSRASEEHWRPGGLSDPPRQAAGDSDRAQTPEPVAAGPTTASDPRAAQAVTKIQSDAPPGVLVPSPLPPRAHSSSPARSVPLSNGTPTFGPSRRPQPPTAAPLGWATLFAPDHADSVRELEGALLAGDTHAAVLRCDSLASELLARAAAHGALAAAERQPALIAVMLGLPGERWLDFKHLVERARDDEPIGAAPALGAFATLIELRRLVAKLR